MVTIAVWSCSFWRPSVCRWGRTSVLLTFWWWEAGHRTASRYHRSLFDGPLGASGHGIASSCRSGWANWATMAGRYAPRTLLPPWPRWGAFGAGLWHKTYLSCRWVGCSAWHRLMRSCLLPLCKCILLEEARKTHHCRSHSISYQKIADCQRRVWLWRLVAWTS